MKETLLIDRALLDTVSAEAAASPRRRKNFNFHEDDAACSHRLLNAIEPASYLAPHRHLDPNKDETMIVLRGRLGIVIFAADGRIEHAVVLEAAGERCGITIPHGVFHTVLALQPGTVMFESKAGPYRPLEPDELAPWAPAEGNDGVESYRATLGRLFA